MENIKRKDFIRKTCLTGFCLCGFSMFALPCAINETTAPEPGETENKKNLQQKWLEVLLSNISEELDEPAKRKILKNCSKTHYEEIDMNKVLAPFGNDLEKFLQFLEKDWNWKIEYDKANKTILANENKNHCVCPIAGNLNASALSALCYCSEGFAEQMFSAVTGAKVRATVVSSIHRGGTNCIYKVEL